ncbi:iron complex transport system ATP-binding protein [Nocardioides cavernae]|uniref:Iron complex transport system ATP-binding protein n=1 Tax=Nocardioides cavernae TaxID=1921566 RepID=A0A7Y9H3S5_9ACTN|nr:ABC transporter ATP-binding protein [Nocardioides cavernae]NYE37444.1 iron complex transport system ATP-binding protein [Nocardioides cavernae]
MITASDLSWAYGGARVLDAVSLAAPHGRVLGLIGPNGSGKTTLLRLLHGALSSPTGEVRVDGDRLADLGARDAARRVAVVVQEAGGENAMTVAEMVLLGRGPHLSTFQRTGRDDHAVAADALARVGAAHLAPRSYAGLSGGERQRVLIARALAQQATHLLLDEPTNHLDIRFQHEVLGLVAGLAHEAHRTVVVVLHDLNLAARYCDDLVLLGDGGIVATGAVDDVLQPAVLEPVYGIGVERVETHGELHLLFRPHALIPTRKDLTA